MTHTVGLIRRMPGVICFVSLPWRNADERTLKADGRRWCVKLGPSLGLPVYLFPSEIPERTNGVHATTRTTIATGSRDRN